jgi:hypothetical protein
MADREKSPSFSGMWRRRLISVVLFLLLCLASFYLAKALAKLPDVWKYMGLVVLAFAGYCLYRSVRSILELIHSVGCMRLIVVISLILGLAVTGIALADKESTSVAQRAGRAVERLLSGGGQLVGQALGILIATGNEIVQSYVSPSATPKPVTEMQIAVGDHVVVDRISGQKLLARSNPGVDQEVSAHFAKGNTLLVVDGPEKVDGYTWWKLRGESGEGWCAEDWVSLVSPP